MRIKRICVQNLVAMSLLCGSLSGFAGCNRKEKVVHIETPAGQIDVDRSKDTGKIDIKIDADRK